LNLRRLRKSRRRSRAGSGRLINEMVFEAHMKKILIAIVLGWCGMCFAGAATGQEMLKDYFELQTAQIASQCLADVKTAEDWNGKKEQYRQQLAEMLGLWPMPEKTELNATITGRLEQDDIVVENLYFQSMPHLYVTANLY